MKVWKFILILWVIFLYNSSSFAQGPVFGKIFGEATMGEKVNVLIVEKSGSEHHATLSSTFVKSKKEKDCEFLFILKQEGKYYYAEQGKEQCKGKLSQFIEEDGNRLTDTIESDAYITVQNGNLIVMHKQAFLIVDSKDKTLPKEFTEKYKVNAIPINDYSNLWKVTSTKGYITTGLNPSSWTRK
jgi:hypothetical protein